MPTEMTIGTLSRQVGLKSETLRYYERLGLIRPKRRTDSNYRLYDNRSLRRLTFIRRAQALGFSLADIGELLSLSEQPGADMKEVKKLAVQRIQDIDAKISDLRKMKQGLMKLSDKCPGHGSTAECPILNTLLAEDQ